MLTADPPRLAKFVDVARFEDAALTAGRSAEALFGYLSRLDELRAADLPAEMLSERAADAELHTRVVLSAGMEALNELRDLGLLDHSIRTARDDPAAVNDVTLSEAVTQMATAFRERVPSGSWSWLEHAGHLVKGVELRVEPAGAALHATVTHSGQSTLVRFDPAALGTRISSSTFFSAGADRVYVPTSSAGIASRHGGGGAPVSAYDAAVRGMAFTREWVYRHARNAAELGPPSRSGGGPVLVVIIIVCVVLAALCAITAAILGFACLGGSDWSCRWAAYLGLAALVLNSAATEADDHSGQPRILTYGSNPQ